MEINYEDFKKVSIKVGTVLEVKKNEKARKPSLIIKVDFGKEIGIKQSSAQITHYYSAENLKGKDAPYVQALLGLYKLFEDSFIKRFQEGVVAEEAVKNFVQFQKIRAIKIIKEGATMPSEADVNAKIQELKDADTATENKKASGKQKLKDLGLDDDEIKALMGA